MLTQRALRPDFRWYALYLLPASAAFLAFAAGRNWVGYYCLNALVLTGLPVTLLSHVRMRRAVRRYRALGRRMCTECGFDLRGVEDRGACPECGAPYDLDDPARPR